MLLPMFLLAATMTQRCEGVVQCSGSIFDTIRRTIASVELGDSFESVTAKWGDGVGGGPEYIEDRQFFAEMYVISDEIGSCFGGALLEAHFDHDWRVCEITEATFTGIRYITKKQFEGLFVGQSECDVARALGQPPVTPGDLSPLEYILVDGGVQYFVSLTFSSEGLLLEKQYYTR